MNQSSKASFYDTAGAPLELKLYMFPSCPFCQKVLRAADRLGMNLPLADIHEDPVARDTLKSVGGRTTVPCLFINGQPLYESDDIVAYLRDKVRTKPA